MDEHVYEIMREKPCSAKKKIAFYIVESVRFIQILYLIFYVFVGFFYNHYNLTSILKWHSLSGIAPLKCDDFVVMEQK